MVREPMSTEVGRECFVERPMLRKLLSVALLALGIGLGVAAHPAQGASYAGGASYGNLPRAPGLLWAHPVSTPASDGAPERAGDRL